MSEAPKRAHQEGSNLEVDEVERQSARETIRANAEFREAILQCENMPAVRNVDIQHIGLSPEKAVSIVSDHNKALLAEALSLWVRARNANGE